MRKICLMISAILSIALNIHAQVINIPDANFKAALISQHVDNNNDNQIQVSEAVVVKTLNLNNSSISDMTGIEYFTSLTSLNCGYNTISRLDISNNIALLNFGCQSNHLSSLNISSNKLLTYVTASDNQLTGIDLSSNKNLAYLNLDSNKITNLDVSQNYFLITLSLNNNQLTDLDLRQNLSLAVLWVDNNNLTSLEVCMNLDLSNLYCGGNPLTNLDLPVGIAVLEINNSHLEGINLSKNFQLVTLYCQGCPFLNLDLSDNSMLQILYCTKSPNLKKVCLPAQSYPIVLYEKDSTTAIGTDCQPYKGADKKFVPVSLGPDTTLCAGQNYTISLKGNYDNVFWSTGDTSQSITIDSAGVYSVYANQNCKFIKGTTTVNYRKSVGQSADFNMDTTICEGKSLSLSIHGNYDRIHWSTGDSSKSITVHQRGSYFVSAYQDCTVSQDTFTINYMKPIETSLIPGLGNDTVICEGKDFSIFLTQSYDSIYWSTGNSSPSITIDKAGTYSVAAYKNCMIYRDTINIAADGGAEAFTGYNLFTPNNDGHNDTFKIVNAQVDDLKLDIYSRWGDKIFQSADWSEMWDGQNAEDGLYYYHLSFSKCKRNHSYKDYIQVIR